MNNALSIWARKNILTTIVTAAAVLMPCVVKAEAIATRDETGTFEMPAFFLPESSLLSAETRDALKQSREDRRTWNSPCPSEETADRVRMRQIRLYEAQWFYTLPFYKALRERYPVTLTTVNMGGVRTEVFTPVEGITTRNRSRVLINLHGGGFVSGSLTSSHLESVPIASRGKIKVISVEYRLAPEYRFPSATQDVEAVYRELLKSYKAQNIGIYGCSAGAMLTAQVVAW